MDILKAHGKKFALIAGAAAFLAGIYFFSGDEKDSLRKSLILTPEQKKNILSQINLQVEDDHLTLESMQQIFEASVPFCLADSLNITREYKERRREVFNDIQKYIAAREQHRKKIAELMKWALKEVLRELEVPDPLWEKSYNYHTQNNMQAMVELHGRISNKVGEAHLNPKKVSLEEFKEIVKTMNRSIEKEAHNAKEVYNYLMNPSHTIVVIQVRAMDLVYMEHGVEWEDIMMCIEDYKQDPEVSKLMQDMKEVIKGIRKFL